MTFHPLATEDASSVAAMRQAVIANKGEALGPEARSMFDDMLAATRAAGGFIELSIWDGVPHVFQSSVGRLAAAEHSDAVRTVGAKGRYERQPEEDVTPPIAEDTARLKAAAPKFGIPLLSK